MEKPSLSLSTLPDFYESEQNKFTLNALMSESYNWNRGAPGTYKSTSLRAALQEICIQDTFSHLFRGLIIVPTLHNSNECARKLILEYPDITFLQVGGKTTYRCYGDLIDTKYGITLDTYKKHPERYPSINLNDFQFLISKTSYAKNQKYYQKQGYEKLCQKEDAHEYDDGCKECEYTKSCEWMSQFNTEKEFDIVICTPFQSNRINHRFVAVDDSFESYPLFEEHFKRSDLEKLGVKFRIEVQTPFKLKRKTTRPQDFFRYYDAKRHHLDFSKIPDDNDTYKSNSSYMHLKWFLQATDKYKEKRYACINSKNCVYLFGYRECLPPHPEGMLFSCGTTSPQVLEFITHTKIKQWNIFASDLQIDQITNPLIQLPTKWNKNRQDQFMHNKEFHIALQKLDEEKIPILMVGKQKFMDILTTQYQNIDFVHYNASRGFNDFCKPYKFILVYGSYRFDPYTRVKMRLIGFTDTMIDDLEISEMYQAVYRARLLTINPYTPILLFTDRLFSDSPRLTLRIKTLLQILQQLNLVFDDLSDVKLRTILQVKSRCSMNNIREVYKILQDRLVSNDDAEFLKWNEDTEWDG